MSAFVMAKREVPAKMPVIIRRKSIGLSSNISTTWKVKPKGESWEYLVLCYSYFIYFPLVSTLAWYMTRQFLAIFDNQTLVIGYPLFVITKKRYSPRSLGVSLKANDNIMFFRKTPGQAQKRGLNTLFSIVSLSRKALGTSSGQARDNGQTLRIRIG